MKRLVFGAVTAVLGLLLAGLANATAANASNDWTRVDSTAVHTDSMKWGSSSTDSTDWGGIIYSADSMKFG